MEIIWNHAEKPPVLYSTVCPATTIYLKDKVQIPGGNGFYRFPQVLDRNMYRF